MSQYHEIITNAVTGEVTEVIRPWTAEELATQAAATVIAQPTISDLKAQLAELAAKLQALENV